MSEIEIIEYLEESKVLKSYNATRITRKLIIVNNLSISLNDFSSDEIINKISNLKNLYSLSIDDNKKLSRIPNNINKLLSLRYLSLNNNQIKEIPEVLNKLINLEYLSLNNNKIEEITNISKLINLRRLFLSTNQIKKIPKIINEFSNLEWLTLSHNRIKYIENISQLNNLEILELSNNQIEKIPQNISKLTKLIKFSIANNFIKKIPNTLSKLKLSYFNYFSLLGNPILENLKDIHLSKMNSKEFILYLLNIQNKIEIKRFFYPVGQGAFYAERHNDFTIVYDCGSKASSKSNHMIKEVFKKNDVIDILFISHFDYDHVSSINELKKWTKIKKVIMPLLQKDEIHLLSNFYTVLEFEDIVKLISNPQKFFGKATKIIKIEPFEDDELTLDNVPIYINNLKRTIKSGTGFNIKSDYNWLFIPFNYKQKERTYKLEEEFLKEGLDIEKFKKNTEYTLKSIKENRAKIRKIYTKLKGDINENSMLLYSGLSFYSSKELKKKSYLFDFKNKIRWHGIAGTTNHVSCIYTGDTNLNIVNIEYFLKKLWETVGTIQIPHHGDIHSFEKNILNNQNYCCPISVGTNNYGHPSKNVIENIISKNSFPILVSEDLSSGFVEYIYEIEETNRYKNFI